MKIVVNECHDRLVGLITSRGLFTCYMRFLHALHEAHTRKSCV